MENHCSQSHAVSRPAQQILIIQLLAVILIADMTVKGDLGVDPIDVERGLEFNFQLAESWGCVLLLDEADVFLAQRGEKDLSRNALVSSKVSRDILQLRESMC